MTISLATMHVLQGLKTFRSSYQKTQSLHNWGPIKQYRWRYEEDSSKITIDGIEKDLKTPKDPLYVPYKFAKPHESEHFQLSQTVLHHLRWMLQKDLLGQDMFLIGTPGPLRRTIVMQFLELTRRELEYVALSRDTTESDLKQRREIRSGTAVYFDQSAVRAAVNGRILVVEGIEKAERNVLPVLNNLLENREMHLEDGRFLIPSARYDKLQQEHGDNEMNKWGLVRVSEDFRVIALGLPVPRYHGVSLDPPLRSRFQCRDVTTETYQETLDNLQNDTTLNETTALEHVLGFAHSLASSNESTLMERLPDVPVANLKSIVRIIEANPSVSPHELIHRLYPFDLFLPNEAQKNVQKLIESLIGHLPAASNQTLSKLLNDKVYRQQISRVERGNESQMNAKPPNAAHYIATVERDGGSFNVSVPAGQHNVGEVGGQFVPTDYHNYLLAEIIQSYAVGDICLIGERGCGKSKLVTQLAHMFNQTIEPMVLYQDMTARDFVQQRTTTPSGDTVWRDSALIRAAKNGSIAVLDGIHRIHNSTICVLHRLIHDREIQLFDGTRLLRHDKYDDMLANGYSDEQLLSKGIFRVHPSFRIVALAEPPIQKGGKNWLSSEMLSLFLFHNVRNLSKTEEKQLIEALYGAVSPAMIKILALASFLRSSKDSVLRNLSTTLSTRQLLRIAHRMSAYPPNANELEHNAYETIQQTFLAKFLPPVPRAALDSACAKHSFLKNDIESALPTEISVADNTLKIGQTSAKQYVTDAVTKIPDIVFFNVPQHIRLMEKLLQDFELGNHLLLVGNQGVGKNKIADRFLQLLKRPREYIQLHRDTTVQSLTTQPTITDGLVVYEDSPLVKAVKYGHVLVVDEADKAPTHVTCILKTFVENGILFLSDGRKIYPSTYNEQQNNQRDTSSDVIYTHPDFRMIVLANRPGFPFLGNDFFASLGDLFSCYSVDNPSEESETFLLRQYGPHVDQSLLLDLVGAFGELRTLSDIGQLSYPYSTREVVNIVKHLEQYPNDDIADVIENVLHFDRYAPEVWEQVTSVLHYYNLYSQQGNEKDSNTSMRQKRKIQLSVERKSGLATSSPKHGKEDPDNEPHVGGNTWAGGTGGRDTAGLGGKGGPYRLDKGHKIHRLSDEEKNDVPEHVKKAARKMNREAFEAKLKEINMSASSFQVYNEFSQPIQGQVKQLRTILNSLQTKQKERSWLKHQTVGDIDDSKLIEGIVGDKNIYRKRGEHEPEPGQPPNKPKRLKIVADVSASMYGMNGLDGRLERELEACLIIMEALHGFDSIVRYDIVGHSGESKHIPFVDVGRPPTNEETRYKILKNMQAHSRFCMSGDFTIQATVHGINSIAAEEADESIVIILSDANLTRYNISPNVLANALTFKEPKVQAYAIFIGSRGKQAQKLKDGLPAGKGFVCMDVADLPMILKQIFVSSFLNSS